jgi:hypothetical protein
MNDAGRTERLIEIVTESRAAFYPIADAGVRRAFPQLRMHIQKTSRLVNPNRDNYGFGGSSVIVPHGLRIALLRGERTLRRRPTAR